MAKLEGHQEAVLVLLSYDLLQQFQRGTDKGLEVNLSIDNTEVSVVELKKENLDGDIKYYYGDTEDLLIRLTIAPKLKAKEIE